MKRVKRSKKQDERIVNDPFKELPNELNEDILMKLPPRSIARLHFASKHLSSIILGKQFTERFMTRSSAQPRHLVIVHGGEHYVKMHRFHSISQEYPHRHDYGCEGICRDGLPEDDTVQEFGELVNHSGKITIATLGCSGPVDLWVLEDVNNEIWSKSVVVMPSVADIFGMSYTFFRGMLGTGEMILKPIITSPEPYFLVCYNPEEGEFRQIVIDEIYNFCYESNTFQVFFDHVESYMVL
ncbi:unnamed protein product [Eruca vesicaria subsp. sativa]|uniref:F-box domain-containing protein n=1 Tax=Eruca vesicaria subsp. sativa TaxID=29727 RepID=A0ABC8J428_ERUVS|nr:unnamed protein product [Eruca vesicaria subsp. sativa]